MKLTHSRAVVLMLLVTLLWSTAGVVSRLLELLGKVTLRLPEIAMMNPLLG